MVQSSMPRTRTDREVARSRAPLESTGRPVAEATPPEDGAAGPAVGPRTPPAPSPEALPWNDLYDRLFARDPDVAAPAIETASRMIRFWLVRVGFRDAVCSTDDVVQDVLLELSRSRASIVDPRALGGWLRTTALRKARDRWRAAQRAPGRASESLELLPAPVLLPDEEVMHKQDRSDLLAAIATLPALLRSCIELQLRGLSEIEIAARLEVELGAPVERHSVKNWLRKARTTLRVALLESRP